MFSLSYLSVLMTFFAEFKQFYLYRAAELKDSETLEPLGVFAVTQLVPGALPADCF